jgi:putative transposase
MVMLAVAFHQDGTKVFADIAHHLLTEAQHGVVKDVPPVFGHKDQVHMKSGNYMSATPVVINARHRPTCYGTDVLARYRYRAYPTPGQAQMLARTFGCARVVFNDALRAREAAHAAGEKISDTEVQRRVITLAKATPEREWLSEVASVALVQACRDARRAYRNWFDSLSGKRKGRKVGHPRFRSRKDSRQSVRLTRNGFGLHGERLYLAKVGDIRIRWSRPLPSEPSSVTIIREADGRYYASFVVEVAATPLVTAEADVGLDLGLSTLATTSDGEKIGNPRHLRRRERHLARAQRALCRTQKGSANRAKARVKVAVQHRKVREARADHLHKTALRLIRDNQAVYVEDLAVSGLARTRLAKSVHDAGWATLAQLLEEKAARYGRTVVRVDRWFPSSQICSVCGVKDGPKPLGVREWTCASCGCLHDRDVNAARNIRLEGRKVAAGLAETQNACGGDIRPGQALAIASETGTHRSAA